MVEANWGLRKGEDFFTLLSKAKKSLYQATTTPAGDFGAGTWVALSPRPSPTSTDSTPLCEERFRQAWKTVQALGWKVGEGSLEWPQCRRA
jgi:hypothetical protein